MAQIIGLGNSPNQFFSTTVNINGGAVTLQLSIYYNEIAGFWVMDIVDDVGNPLVYSVPLLTGVWPAANILAPYQYLNIGSAFVINVSGSTSDYPNDTNLGTAFILLWDNNTDYVVGQQFGGNVIIIGPIGPQGPQGPPGPGGGGSGGIFVMGTSGTITPDLSSGDYTQQSTLTATANLAAPASPTAGTIFLVQLIQPTLGGVNVTFASFYRGLSAFILDTTGSTQAALVFQVSLDTTYCTLLNVAQNGNPIA